MTVYGNEQSTSRIEFVDIGKRLLREALRSGEKRQWSLRLTSGTSGGRPLFFASQFKTPSGRTLQSRCRTMIFVGMRWTRVSSAVGLFYLLPEESWQNLFIDADDFNQSLKRAWQEFLPDRLMGMPSVILRAAALIEDKKAFERITTVVLAGEILSTATVRKLQEYFPKARVARQYIVSELGIISARSCPYTTGNQFHPAPGIDVRILSPDEDGIGEIMVSKNLGSSIEVVNYRTGDLGRLSSPPCPCGSVPLFEIVGRQTGDYLKVAGAILRREEFDRVIGELSTFIADYALEAGTVLVDERIYGSIQMSIVPCTQERPEEFLGYLTQEIMQRVFVTPTKTIAQLVAESLFLPLQLSLVNALPVHVKAVKLRYTPDAPTTIA